MTFRTCNVCKCHDYVQRPLAYSSLKIDYCDVYYTCISLNRHKKELSKFMSYMTICKEVKKQGDEDIES